MWQRAVADGRSYERHITRLECLVSVAHRARGDLAQAKPHLEEALHRCRRINLVELELDMLLALGWLRRDQAKVPGTPASRGEVPGTGQARGHAERPAEPI